MTLGIYFPVEGMSADTYDEVIRRLDDAGAGAPAGRMYHFAFEVHGGIHVFDVFDSQESFEAFGQTLMPILGELGVKPPEPSISPMHNIIDAG